MPAFDPLQRITILYHFTDRRNLPSIREQGGLHPLSDLRHKQIAIPAPGGNEWSHDADAARSLDRYVHLCFRATHPMEYRARQEGRIADSIFLHISAEVLQWDGSRFTPDVSNKSGVESYTIEQARSMIDFDVLYTRTDWRDQAIKQRLQQAEKYEILVPRSIPLELIRNLPSG